MIYFCPESPRWLMKKGRYVAAWKAMIQLRNHPIQCARDMYSIHAQLQLEGQVLRKNNYATRFTQLFTIPRVRRANLAAFTVMIAQQMCGKLNLTRQPSPLNHCPVEPHPVISVLYTD